MSLIGTLRSYITNVVNENVKIESTQLSTTKSKLLTSSTLPKVNKENPMGTSEATKL
jgi:hypothetical protein